MNSSSYNAKKQEQDQEIESLRLKLSSLEDKASEVIKELILELEKSKIKNKKKKPTNNNKE